MIAMDRNDHSLNNFTHDVAEDKLRRVEVCFYCTQKISSTLPERSRFRLRVPSAYFSEVLSVIANPWLRRFLHTPKPLGSDRKDFRVGTRGGAQGFLFGCALDLV
jgi:hypothetical protein